MIENEKDGTVEIREQLQEGDERSWNVKMFPVRKPPIVPTKFARTSTQEMMRLINDGIEKEEREKDMAEKLRTGRIVECQVGGLKFRVQPPSPKLKVNRVKELPP